MLSQSFHQGWNAYEIDCDLDDIVCKFKLKLAPLFFKRLEDHQIVNNWANAWRLNAGNAQKENKLSYLILFNPFYIQYFGYVVTVLTLIILIKDLSFKKDRK